jgi:solute carrier family 13 (sodium-dependent dicarboxylate transporter), member 2/3/5
MSESSSIIKFAALLIGPLLAAATGFALTAAGHSAEAGITLGVTVLCVVWWVFEPVPIPATSLLPLAILPLTGVLPQRAVSEAYGHNLILLLLGGFILSTAMEKSGAHRRIALGMVRAFGGHSSRALVFGFMAAAALLSMWISNTATTLMLLPVALAVLERTPDPKLATPLLLGIAYAASLGGIGTPIGTPPNVIFMGIYETTTGNAVAFSTWMTWAVPVVVVFLPLMALWLTRNLAYQGSFEVPAPGPWRREEIRVMTVFAITAVAWITRTEPFGGWTALFGAPYSNDGIVALLAVVVMCIVPDGQGGRLLDWQTAQRIPWGMLILFGGGLAIASAFGASGLSAAIGEALSVLTNWYPLVLMLIICFAVTFLTEATSNTATTSLLMPILAATALGAAIDPRLLMVPAAMSASCAFMLPVATAPNVIMFSTGRFNIDTMMREGFALNLIGVVVIAHMCYLLIR